MQPQIDPQGNIYFVPRLKKQYVSSSSGSGIATGARVVDVLPSDGFDGQLVYLTTDDTLYAWAEGGWQPAGSGGSGGIAIGDAVNNYPSTNGILYVDGSGTLQNDLLQQQHIDYFGGVITSEQMHASDDGVFRFGFVNLSGIGQPNGAVFATNATTPISTYWIDTDNLTPYAAIFIDPSNPATNFFGLGFGAGGINTTQTFFVNGAGGSFGVPLSMSGNKINNVADGTSTSDAVNYGQLLAAATSPGGSNTQIQFNNSGAFGGSASFTWDNSNKKFIVKGKSSQSVNLVEIQDNSANILSGVDSRGVAFSTMNQNTSTIFGINAGNASASGTGNTLVGNNAGKVITSGSQNVAIGFDSLIGITTGNFNFGLGAQTGKQITTGLNNIFIGQEAGKTTSTDLTSVVAIGQQAGIVLSGQFNFSTLIGDYAGRNAPGIRNSGVGQGVLLSATGGYNSALGVEAGKLSGDRGVYLGYQAGAAETGNDKLYIANSATTTPLIYGDFAAEQLKINGLFFPRQLSSAPTYVEGAIYYDTTLHKLRVGGAVGWETITSV